MNKLQILAKNSHTFFIDRVKEEAELLGVEVGIINPWLERIYQTNDQEVFLVRTTAIHGTDDDLNFIEEFNLKTLPSLKALRVLRTKPHQFAYFESLDIAHLPWLNLLTSSEEEILAFAQDKKKLLIKPQRGQGGWGVRVFLGVEELLAWWRVSSDREYLLQPYIEEHEEVRVFFMGKTFLALKRLKKGVAANFRQEGEAIAISVPLELEKIVEKIRQDLDLPYGAADFLLYAPKGTPYLLEMNLVPGIEQLEGVTGRNIAQELLSIFLKP
ncbi:MAG TPA: hypothetical protein VKY27_05430 [Bacteriovoracaceae bacterium]|nr:hypothetical protein [Bacteriovoracaceae bacterium]